MHTIPFCASPAMTDEAITLVVPAGTRSYWQGRAEKFGELSLGNEDEFYVELTVSGCVDGEPSAAGPVSRFSPWAEVLRTVATGADAVSDARYIRERMASGLHPCLVAAYCDNAWV